MNNKYQSINTLAGLIGVERASATINDFKNCNADDRKRLLPYMRPYIISAILKRFPNISESTLRKKVLHILQNEFAFD